MIYDKSSLEAWREHNTREIMLSEHLSVKVRHYDVLSLIAGEDGQQNPLMAIMARVTGQGGDASDAQAALSNPQTLTALAKTLDEVMVKVVVSPPIKEAGAEDGISVKEIPFEFKMRVFEALIGSEGLPQASAFPNGQASGVVAGPES